MNGGAGSADAHDEWLLLDGVACEKMGIDLRKLE